MRKYLDIPLTLAVTLTLTVAMLWPLEAPPPAPEGSDKLVHFIAFAALAFPLARTGRIASIAGPLQHRYGRQCASFFA